MDVCEAEVWCLLFVRSKSSLRKPNVARGVQWYPAHKKAPIPLGPP